MNEEAKQALILKYKDIIDNYYNNNELYGYNYIVDWNMSLHNSEDILLRLLFKTNKEFGIDSQPYIKFILYFKENNWYKYNSNNPYPIQCNLATTINNFELFKLIKRRLLFCEKRSLQYFISNIINRCQEDLTENESDKIILKHTKLFNNSIRILKDLKIDSEFYQSLKILMEQTFTLEDKNYQQI